MASFAHRLHGVQVNWYAGAVRNRADPFNIEDHARLIVGVHYRNQRGVRPDFLFQLGQIEPSRAIHTDFIHPASSMCQTAR